MALSFSFLLLLHLHHISKGAAAEEGKRHANLWLGGKGVGGFSLQTKHLFIHNLNIIAVA